MDPGTGSVGGLSVSSRSERGCVIAALSGELDIACAPALREKLLGSLRLAASRLVIDLSRVSYADASGLAVLVGTGRRAGLLGGFSRLAAPMAEVDTVLRRCIRREMIRRRQGGHGQRHHRGLGAHRAGPARRRRC